MHPLNRQIIGPLKYEGPHRKKGQCPRIASWRTIYLTRTLISSSVLAARNSTEGAGFSGWYPADTDASAAPLFLSPAVSQFCHATETCYPTTQSFHSPPPAWSPWSCDTHFLTSSPRSFIFSLSLHYTLLAVPKLVKGTFHPHSVCVT